MCAVVSTVDVDRSHQAMMKQQQFNTRFETAELIEMQMCRVALLQSICEADLTFRMHI